jgi:hypothetical protein
MVKIPPMLSPKERESPKISFHFEERLCNSHKNSRIDPPCVLPKIKKSRPENTPLIPLLKEGEMT